MPICQADEYCGLLLAILALTIFKPYGRNRYLAATLRKTVLTSPGITQPLQP